MTTDDFEKFHEGIVGVMSFYGKDLSTFALDVWWNAMKAYDLPAITDAFGRWLMNPDAGQFPPKPADIAKMLGGRTEDRALMAWAKVDRAVRVVGTYRSVVFDDPLIHRVMHEMGGWISLGQKTEDEWPFVGKEFATRYRGYAMRGEHPGYPPVMIGIAQAHNDAKHLPNDPPKLIGNPIAAEAVMANGNAGATLQISTAGALCGDSALRLIQGSESAA